MYMRPNKKCINIRFPPQRNAGIRLIYLKRYFMPTPIKSIVAPRADVEIYLVTLDVDAEHLDHYAQLLSPDEQARAERFHFERDARRFTVARGTLRLLLGERLNIPPQDIQFIYTDKGKPQLRHNTDITFNTSHSHERALHAFARARDVGVDIEYQERKVDYEALAERYFTKNELAWLRTMSALERKPAFLSCWTRKEALAKATGAGLAMIFDRVEVHPELNAITSHVANHTLYTLNIGDAYAAALAIAK